MLRMGVRDPRFLWALLLAVTAQRSSSPPRNAATLAVADKPAVAAVESTGLLEAELELARRGGFYLVVDPIEQKLRLKLEGIELTRYRILAVELGQPHFAFVSVARSPLGQPRVFEGGRLLPERQRERREVVIAGQQGKGTDPAAEIPPLPDEEQPPQRFLVAFPGLELEIISAGGARTGIAGLADRLVAAGKERIAALQGDASTPRLRLVLPAEDAASCYRSLPPGTRLLTPSLFATP